MRLPSGFRRFAKFVMSKTRASGSGDSRSACCWGANDRGKAPSSLAWREERRLVAHQCNRTNQMRIAFIVDSFPNISETFILAQVVGLLQRGHEVDIVADPPPRS